MTTIAPPTTSTGSRLIHQIAFLLLLIAGVAALAIIIRAIDGAPATYRTPAWAIQLHLATVIPALPLGAWLLWRPVKGDATHRVAGRLWAMLMIVTAIDSFWIRTITGGIGPIHLFSVLTLVQLPRAIWFAKTGQIDRHMKTMRGVFFGLIAAGLFAMAPGRTLWALVFG